uniref:RRM domain-containing protein n=1 Tax=Heterorhabditis bacteriophora TaxID=37862 RepID=A0A1I7X350_HETBA
MQLHCFIPKKIAFDVILFALLNISADIGYYSKGNKIWKHRERGESRRWRGGRDGQRRGRGQYRGRGGPMRREDSGRRDRKGDKNEKEKCWQTGEDQVTIIFVEHDKAKQFMLKYNNKVLSGLRINVGLEKSYLNLAEVTS